ncbi:MAG: tetratricopeptide repeat protein [Candidatus Omnitrophica bacterium]|nr:tetratricopeptide repeat protein [Candidatus Omnitrophota bacterium]
MSIVWSVLRDIAKLFGSQRKLWVPFLLVAVVEALFLGLVWLAPHPPFSTYLAPPIRYFFSDRVLHYPAHLWFLFHVMKHTHLAALTLAGAFMTGVVCVMVRQAHDEQALSLREALVGKQVRYGTVVILWLITWGLAKGLGEAASQITQPALWMAWGLIGATVLLQALLAYAIPVAVFEQAKWWTALARSAREMLRYPVSTLVVVGVPSAASIVFGMVLTPQLVSHLMLRVAPEIAVPLVALRLAVWTVIDAVMTVAIVHLWWRHRAPQAAPAAVKASTTPPPPFLRPAKALLGAMSIMCLFFTAGCSEAYNGERLFWKAQQVAAPVLKNPAQATPEQFAKSHEALRLVIEKAPGTVWAARAQAGIGGLFVLQKELANAREAYRLVIQNYGQFKDLALNSRAAIAKTYELEQDWPEAIKAYNEILEFHPWSTIGLQAPLYVALIHSKQLQQPDQAAKAYERAARLYEKLIPDAPNPGAAAQAKGYLAQAYERLEQWDRAIAVLNDLLVSPEGVNRPLTLLMLGSIYQTRKNDPQKAGEIYTQLITEFPKNPLSQVAVAQMKHLGLPIPEGVEASGAASDAADTQTTKPAIPPVPSLGAPGVAPN